MLGQARLGRQVGSTIVFLDLECLDISSTLAMQMLWDLIFMLASQLSVFSSKYQCDLLEGEETLIIKMRHQEVGSPAAGCLTL